MKNILIVTFLLLSTVESALSKDVSPLTKIKKLYGYTTGAVLELENQSTNNSGCSYSKSGKYLAIRFNTAEERALYSTILTAFTAEINVKIASRDCDPIWGTTKTMNKIYNIVLYK